MQEYPHCLGGSEGFLESHGRGQAVMKPWEDRGEYKKGIPAKRGLGKEEYNSVTSW